VRDCIQNGDRECALRALLDARHELQAAVSFLPPHDIQSYENAWGELHRELSRPSRSFRFQVGQKHEETSDAGTAVKVMESTNGAMITAHPSPDVSSSSTAVRLRTKEVINMQPSTAAVYLVHLDTCFIHMGDEQVPGSVFLDGCKCCVVTGSAGQCRLSNSSNIVVCIDTHTPITLEGCRSIWIARPGTLQRRNSPASSACTYSDVRAPSVMPSVQDFDDIFHEQLHHTPLPVGIAADLVRHWDEPCALPSILNAPDLT